MPQQALQIVIPLNAVPGSSFQIENQNIAYVNSTLIPGLPQPFDIYVGGQQPLFTFALSDFTACPIIDEVSVNELSSAATSISVRPNPSNGIVSIVTQNKIAKIELLSITGQVLSSEIINDKTHQLQLQNFAESIYFVKISYPNGLSVTKKVVKQ